MERARGKRDEKETEAEQRARIVDVNKVRRIH